MKQKKDHGKQGKLPDRGQAPPDIAVGPVRTLLALIPFGHTPCRQAIDRFLARAVPIQGSCVMNMVKATANGCSRWDAPADTLRSCPNSLVSERTLRKIHRFNRSNTPANPVVASIQTRHCD
jgi:hypothetical protein